LDVIFLNNAIIVFDDINTSLYLVRIATYITYYVLKLECVGTVKLCPLIVDAAIDELNLQSMLSRQCTVSVDAAIDGVDYVWTQLES
jgi:hypothetical protein